MVWLYILRGVFYFLHFPFPDSGFSPTTHNIKRFFFLLVFFLSRSFRQICYYYLCQLHFVLKCGTRHIICLAYQCCLFFVKVSVHFQFIIIKKDSSYLMKNLHAYDYEKKSVKSKQIKWRTIKREFYIEKKTLKSLFLVGWRGW